MECLFEQEYPLQKEENGQRTETEERRGWKDRQSFSQERFQPLISSIVRGANETMVTVFYFYDFVFLFCFRVWDPSTHIRVYNCENCHE